MTPCARGRDLFFGEGPCELPGPVVTHQHLCLDQGIDDLLQVEGIPLCLVPDENILSCLGMVLVLRRDPTMSWASEGDRSWSLISLYDLILQPGCS